MWVELGNARAVEGQRLHGDDKVRLRPLEGRRVTRVVLPDGLSLNEARHTVVAQIRHHFAKGNKPVWVDSDSVDLKRVLSEQFGLDPDHERPANWGTYQGAT